MSIKISQQSRMNDTPTGRGIPPAKPKLSFDQALTDRREHVNEQQLRALLTRVDEQAGRVSARRTIRDVRLYKQYVETFLREAVRSGLGTREARSWQQGGTRQILVKTVNEKLIRLTEDLLENNKDELAILDQLDEIRGLLINLYI